MVVGQPLQRQGIPTAVDPTFTTVFECHDHVHLQRNEREVPILIQPVVLLNLLYIFICHEGKRHKNL